MSRRYIDDNDRWASKPLDSEVNEGLFQADTDGKKEVLTKSSSTLTVPKLPEGVLSGFTGMLFPDDLSFEDWQVIAIRFRMAYSANQWQLGDWLLQGERCYGGMYTQAVEDTGRAYDTLRKLVQVARKFEIGRRRPNLSWSHHEAVASMVPALAEPWLDRAEKEQLSVSMLRELIRADKPGADNKLRLTVPKVPVVNLRIEDVDPDSMRLNAEVSDLRAAIQARPILTIAAEEDETPDLFADEVPLQNDDIDNLCARASDDMASAWRDSILFEIGDYAREYGLGEESSLEDIAIVIGNLVRDTRRNSLSYINDARKKQIYDAVREVAKAFGLSNLTDVGIDEMLAEEWLNKRGKQLPHIILPEDIQAA